MIESSASSDNSLLSRLNVRSMTLQSIASMARSGSGSNAVNALIDGSRAVNDRLSVATSSRFTSEAAGLDAAAASAREAASLLQIADKGLSEISDKLAEMKVLVEFITTSTNPDTSTLDRAILNRDFSDLRTEIDAIVNATEFNGVKLLQGDGAGGQFNVTFKVGTGQESGDLLTISLDSALVADLSSGLATDSLATEAEATTALTNVTEAINNLNAIAGAVDGYGEAVFLAAEIASDISSELNRFNGQRVAVDVLTEAAQYLSKLIAEDGGATLSNQDTTLIGSILNSRDGGSVGGNASLGSTSSGSSSSGSSSSAAQSSDSDD